MTLRQTAVVAFLTAAYLCFELAFNARLLDVVGGAASPAQLHDIERYGRSLSGIAVALVLLQWLLGRRARSTHGSPRGLAILFWCLVAAGLTYGALQLLVDQLVDRSTPELRRASLNMVLVQRALVTGSVQLDGLGDDPGLFARPEGKAFLALFPAMAVSVERLDEKIRDAKLELLSRAVAERLGGPAGYYDDYAQTVSQTQAQWQRYQRLPGAADLDAEIARRQDRAWSEYLADLGRRGWTPSTVPAEAQGTVRRRVRARAPVAAHWDLADEAGFRQAVAAQVRRKAGSGAGDGGIIVQGRRVPPGLAWPAFFAHAGVQAQLRDSLKLPAGVPLRPAYGSGAAFEREVFAPVVADLARRELVRYDAPAATFADGRQHAEIGRDAARAVIVPPVALLFSLLGAIGHLAKLCYLLLRLAVALRPAWRARARHLWLAPVAVLAFSWGLLSLIDNPVTQSRLYGAMRAQLLQGAPEDAAAALRARALANALHVVAVGQGHGYPVNELVRTRLLGGITYGYPEPSR